VSGFIDYREVGANSILSDTEILSIYTENNFVFLNLQNYKKWEIRKRGFFEECSQLSGRITFLIETKYLFVNLS